MAAGRTRAECGTLKIWLIDHYTNLPSGVGDARQFSNARELIRRGHEARVVLCPFSHLTHRCETKMHGSRWRNIRVDGVPVTLIRACGYNTNFELARIRNMFEFAWGVGSGAWCAEAETPDVVVGSAPDPWAALAAERLARRFKARFVLEIRDPWPFAITEITGRSRNHPFVVAVDRTMRYLYRKAERILILSRRSKDLLVESGAEEKKIVWVPHAIDLEMNPTPKPSPEDGVFTVTYLGAHNPWNDLDSILDAAEALQRSGGPRVNLRFVGDGVCKPALRARAERAGLRNVRFDEPVPKERVREVLHASDAFILNNRRDRVSERWMSFNKLFDYLAAGRPVIFGSWTEDDPVRESGAGISVRAGDGAAMADAILRIASEPAQAQRAYGERGRRFIEERYSTQAVMNRFEAVVQSLGDGANA